MQLIIDQQQAQVILNYLIKQPYGEVANFVLILQRLQPYITPKPASPTSEDNGKGQEQGQDDTAKAAIET